MDLDDLDNLGDMVKKNLLVIAILTVVGVFVFSQLGYNIPFISSSESCPLVRPYFGSVNCVTDQSETSTQTAVGGNFYCSADDHECKFLNVEHSDVRPACDITALTYGSNLVDLSTSTPVWECSASTLSSAFCVRNLQQYALVKNHAYQFNIWCTYATGTGPPTNQGDYKANFVSYGEHFEVHMDSGVVPLAGAHSGCKSDELWNSEYGSEQPASNSISTIKEAASLYNFQTSLPSTLDIPADSYAGQAYWMVYDWVARPDIILSKKAGQEVWCDPTSNTLTSIGQVTSVTGQCYKTPISKLNTVQCCNSATCSAIYNDPSYVCDSQWSETHEPTFTCVKGGAVCQSDYQCSGSAPVCRIVDSAFQLTQSKCVNGQCSPQTTAVACCTGTDGGPNICAHGQYCDYTKGCTGLAQTCPSGMCCHAPSYVETSCPSGLICCPSGTDLNLGTCAQQCTGPSGCETTCKAQGYQTGTCTGASIFGSCDSPKKSLGANSGGCGITSSCCCSGSNVNSALPWLWMILLAVAGFMLGQYVFVNEDEDTKKRYSLALAIIMGVAPLLLSYMGMNLPDIQTPLATCSTDSGIFGGVVSWVMKVVGGVDVATTIFYISIVLAVITVIATQRVAKLYLEEKMVPFIAILAGVITYKFVCSFFWIGVIIILAYIVYVIAKTVGPPMAGSIVSGLNPLSKIIPKK